MARTPKALTVQQYQALQNGMPTYCPNAVFTIAGQSYTTPQVVALIAAILAKAEAVAPAKATASAAISAVNEAIASDGQIVKEVRQVVALMFKNAPATLASLAIAPRKTPAPLSAIARAAAEAKAAATRKARGTTSKKQKALIVGNVTGVTITPTTAPTAAPAASAPVATTAPAAAVPVPTPAARG
jgi:hypothetical protein